MFKMVEYLEAKAKAMKPMPKAILLEQSMTLMGKYKESADQIKARLVKQGYSVDMCVMDTLKHGLPQSRERTYLVGYNRVHTFKFPKPLKTVMPIERTLFPKKLDVESGPVGACKRARIRQALAEARQCGYNPDKETILIDIDSSDPYWKWRASESMTLTRGRSLSGGWFVSSRKRRQAVGEMLMLQGIPPRMLGDISLLSVTAIRSAIGNSMSVNILERLLPRVCWSIGISHKIDDMWENEAWVLNGGRFNVQ